MGVRDHELFVEQHGPAGGPAVVLLHHGLGSTSAWEATRPALATAGYRVVVYDRWGYGRSQAREGLSTPAFAEDVADLEALVEHFELSRLALVGHSDGGTIALAYASAHPEQVAALVVIAAHIYLEAKMASGIQGVAQAFRENARFQQGLARAHGEKTGQVFRNWYEGWTGAGAASRLDGWDMRPTLARITCPTLVMQGLDDEHATPAHAQDLAAAIPNAELWLAPGAGHMLPQDQPEPFNQKLFEFLGRYGNRW